MLRCARSTAGSARPPPSRASPAAKFARSNGLLRRLPLLTSVSLSSRTSLLGRIRAPFYDEQYLVRVLHFPPRLCACYALLHDGPAIFDGPVSSRGCSKNRLQKATLATALSCGAQGFTTMKSLAAVSFNATPRKAAKNAKVELSLTGPDSSRIPEDPPHHFSVHVGQAEVPPLELEGQPLVVDPQQAEDGGLEVVHVYRVLHHVVGVVVGLAVGQARADAAA